MPTALAARGVPELLDLVLLALRSHLDQQAPLPGQRRHRASLLPLCPFGRALELRAQADADVPQFTPDARRILTGSTSGEFTLWNGLTFNFETILQVRSAPSLAPRRALSLYLVVPELTQIISTRSQAHDSAVRALSWSHSGQWLLSADNAGVIKYFQQNMNNLQVFQGHGEAIRDATWAPNDERFATGADDGVIKVWNFERMKEERVLTGASLSLTLGVLEGPRSGEEGGERALTPLPRQVTAGTSSASSGTLPRACSHLGPRTTSPSSGTRGRATSCRPCACLAPSPLLPSSPLSLLSRSTVPAFAFVAPPFSS